MCINSIIRICCFLIIILFLGCESNVEECIGGEGTVAVFGLDDCQKFSDFNFRHLPENSLIGNVAISAEQDSNIIIIWVMIDSVEIEKVYRLSHPSSTTYLLYAWGIFNEGEYLFDPGMNGGYPLTGGIVFTSIDTTREISGYFLDNSSMSGVVRSTTDHDANEYFKVEINGGFSASRNQ